MELEAFLTKITRGLVKHHVRHGLSKKEAKTLGIKCIRSLGTERNYQAAIYKFLQWRNSCGLSVKRNYLRLEMTEFLHEQSELLQQTQLDIVRRAMELVFAVELQGVVSTRLTLLNARSYFSHEIAAICEPVRNFVCKA
jgi:hypothetical protein